MRNINETMQEENDANGYTSKLKYFDVLQKYRATYPVSYNIK